MLCAPCTALLVTGFQHSGRSDAHSSRAQWLLLLLLLLLPRLMTMAPVAAAGPLLVLADDTLGRGPVVVHTIAHTHVIQSGHPRVIAQQLVRHHCTRCREHQALLPLLLDHSTKQQQCCCYCWRILPSSTCAHCSFTHAHAHTHAHTAPLLLQLPGAAPVK